MPEGSILKEVIHSIDDQGIEWIKEVFMWENGDICAERSFPVN